MVSLSDIQSVASQIAREFHPEKILLFGSYAYGKPTPDSDVDLLVSMRTSLRPAEQAARIRKAIDFPFPVDLLVRTPEQIEQRLAMGDGFIRDVTCRGKALYEADHKRMG